MPNIHYLLQRSPKLIIRMLGEGVNIVSHGSHEQHRILRYDGDLFPEIVKADLRDVDPVDHQPPFGFGDAEQHGDEGAFSGTSPSHNSHLETGSRN